MHTPLRSWRTEILAVRVQVRLVRVLRLRGLGTFLLCQQLLAGFGSQAKMLLVVLKEARRVLVLALHRRLNLVLVVGLFVLAVLFESSGMLNPGLSDLTLLVAIVD